MCTHLIAYISVPEHACKHVSIIIVAGVTIAKYSTVCYAVHNMSFTHADLQLLEVIHVLSCRVHHCSHGIPRPSFIPFAQSAFFYRSESSSKGGPSQPCMAYNGTKCVRYTYIIYVSIHWCVLSGFYSNPVSPRGTTGGCELKHVTKELSR